MENYGNGFMVNVYKCTVVLLYKYYRSGLSFFTFKSFMKQPAGRRLKGS